MFSVTRILLIAFVAITIAVENEDCKEKLMGTLIPQYANSVIDTTAYKIMYPKNITVDCGNKLGALATTPTPVVQYDVNSKCINTTVLFIGIPYNFYDTDAIVGYPFLHWLVHNIPAKVLKEGFHEKEEYTEVYTKTDYLFPLNPFNDHRYTFFVYCQERYIEPHGKKNDILLDRPSFQPKTYAEEFDLGDPLAINYFVSTLVTGVGLPPSLVEVD